MVFCRKNKVKRNKWRKKLIFRTSFSFEKSCLHLLLLTSKIRKYNLIGRERCRHQGWADIRLYTTFARPTEFILLQISYKLYLRSSKFKSHHVWTRKRRQGTRIGRRQASQKDPEGQHPRYHQASYPKIGPTRWCQTYLWTHLRRDPRSLEGLPRERHQRCRHLHRARQAQDCDRHGRRLRLETPRTYLVRIRRLNTEFKLYNKRRFLTPHIRTNINEMAKHFPGIFPLKSAKGLAYTRPGGPHYKLCPFEPQKWTEVFEFNP